ncbi:hypothetical protein FOVG_01382 [Fusarium oxysporum f. sp. pisi HDV247]|nr:hypothetical protein FOVG_01382 [Fusarium oxysporum f. sp. pisi HDV247]
MPGLAGQPIEDQDDDATSPSSWVEGVHWACKKRAIDKVLATISDLQIMNALAILLAALIQHQSMSLYHLHIVYDTASFTGISVCASLINVSTSKDELKRTRAIPLALFVVAYVSFSVIFGIQLARWDEGLPGRCYNTQFVASPSTAHPLGDYIYLGITCLYSVSALLSCYRSSIASPSLVRLFSRSSPTSLLPTTSHTTLESSSSSVPPIFENRFWAKFSWFIDAKNFDFRIVVSCGIGYGMSQVLHFVAAYFALLVHEKPEYRVWAIVPLAMGQYPLHLYMVIALRVGNESLLSGDSENTWGFGQIVALILCAATLLGCVRGVSEYRKTLQLQRNFEESEVVQDGQVQAVRTERRRRNSY